MATPSDNPHPIPLTESEVLIRGFLAANPDLDANLGPVDVMTDRYTNEEWDAQIKATIKNVMSEVESGVRGSKVYPGPRMRNGEEALMQLSKTIDHTVLKLDATSAMIDALCSEARTDRFKSVCVRLNWVQRCVSNLKGTDVLVACVVGFHEGTQDTLDKLREARAAVQAGATELDVVLNHSILTRHNHYAQPSAETIPVRPSRDSAIDSITAANTLHNASFSASPLRNNSPGTGSHSKSSSSSSSSNNNTTTTTTTSTSSRTAPDKLPDYSLLYRELASLRSLCPRPITLKLILETSTLSDAQILAAAHLAAAASFDFIKTSTGFHGPGATIPHVQLMVGAAEYLAQCGVGGSRKMQVKASGGVRDLDTAVKMLEAGATRLGTSSGLWIMQEARRRVGEERMLGAGGVEGEKVERPGGVTRLYTDDSFY